MKITDLKPNDVIHIKTKKEAKGINKLFKDTYGYNPKFKHGFYAIKHAEYNFTLVVSIPNTYCIFSASKFLKPSLNKRVKALERKINILEKGSDFMQEINNIEVNTDEVANCNDAPVNKELTELPEKWCVKADNYEIIEWVNTNIYDYIDRSEKHPIIYVTSGLETTFRKKEDYILLSTEDFKRLVLKENEHAKEPESIDWSKSNILEHKGHGKPYLVLSNPIGNQYYDKFLGTMIYTSPDYTNLRHGEYDSFDKSDFKLYKGEPITLKND